MKRLILILTLCLAANAQVIFGGGKVAAVVGPRGDTLPATCSVGQLFTKTGATTPGIYGCGTADTWTIMQGGEGSYTLPTATADVLGGIKVGDNLAIVDGVLAAAGDVVGTTGSGAPSANCTAGKAVYTDTGTGYVYSCGPTANTWRRILTTADDATGELELGEDPDNGTSKWTIAAPDALSADRELVLPDAAGTAGQVLVVGTPDGTTLPLVFATPSLLIGAGTASLGTAEIASEACASVVTVSATGVATTDIIAWTPNADITAVTGYAPVTEGGLSIYPYPTANNVNFKVCNPTAAAITPGAVTLNWRVVR